MSVRVRLTAGDPDDAYTEVCLILDRREREVTELDLTEWRDGTRRLHRIAHGEPVDHVTATVHGYPPR